MTFDDSTGPEILLVRYGELGLKGNNRLGFERALMRNIRTQQKGSFTINGLPGRDYLIVALADDQVPDVLNPAVYEALARAATSLTLSDGDTRTVSIKIAQVVR